METRQDDGPDHPQRRDHGRWERDRLRRDDGEDPDPRDTDNQGREEENARKLHKEWSGNYEKGHKNGRPTS